MIYRRPAFRRAAATLLILTLVLSLAGELSLAQNGHASPIPNRSFFGMNLYITGQERPKEERYALMNAAQDLGVKWSREEISWANLEPDRKGIYNWGSID